MRKQVLYGIIAVLVIAVGYLIYALETEKQILKESINELAELQGVMADQSYELENITVISKLQHYAEGRSVDNYTLYSADGDSCKLQDVCKEKKLVYYLSEQGCQICYQPFLEKLNDLADKIGKENIVVIAKFSEKRVFKLFLQDLDFEMKPAVYQCRTDFDIYPEYNDYAMAFLLAKDLVIDNICITDKSNTKLSGDYLKLIEKEFEEGR